LLIFKFDWLLYSLNFDFPVSKTETIKYVQRVYIKEHRRQCGRRYFIVAYKNL
jgi:hypothetical protein